ncbi:MAG: hypothetical protein ACI841_000139 [Planctomycetota bacterium]|jgi:hypothetical protein
MRIHELTTERAAGASLVLAVMLAGCGAKADPVAEARGPLAAGDSSAEQTPPADAAGRGVNANRGAQPVSPSGRRDSPPFRARVELETRGLPEGVLVIDLNHDGRSELIAVTKNPGSMHVWEALDAQPTRIDLPDYPLGPVAVSFPQAQMIAVASRASKEILLLDPLAKDPLANAAHFALGGTPRAFGSGDLDGDGAPDLVCALREGQLIWIGTGGVLKSTDLVESQPTTLLVSEGRVIVGSQGCACLCAYRLIDGQLVADESVITLGGIPRDMVSLREGGSEMLAVVGGDHHLWWIGASQHGSEWLRSEQAFLGGAHIEPSDGGSGAIPIDLTHGDASAAQSGTLIRLNHGGQSFQVLDMREDQLRPVGPPTYAGQDPWAASVGDLNDDGLADLAIANRGASRVSIVLGTDGEQFESGALLPVGRGPHSTMIADLFGDEVPEIGVIGALSGTLQIAARDSDTWRIVAEYSARPAGDLLRSADLDRDGSQDLAFMVRDDASARVRVLWGDGKGGYATDTDEVVAGSGVGDLLLHDWDRDGQVEMFVADPDRGRVMLWSWGSRTAKLLASIEVPSIPTALCPIDANGDGKDEIAVALGEPGPRTGFAILQVSEEGATRMRELAHIPTAGFSLDICDAELDGKGPRELCLLVKPQSHDGPGRLRVFALEAASGAWLQRADLITGQRPYALAAGDYDADGREDIIVGAQNSHHVNLWRSTADGLLRQADLGVGRGVLDVSFQDLNGDGMADVVAGNNFSNDLSILLVR